MRNYYGLTLLLGTLAAGLVFTTQASDDPDNGLLLAQIYGSICVTASYECQLNYEDIVGSPCECEDEYGTIVEY